MPSRPSLRRSKPASRQVPYSAGCLVTRWKDGTLEVLLVHPRGATFRKPLFGIPKGLVEPGEVPEEAAVRETREETGLDVVLRADLGEVQQKSGKIVRAYWAEPTAESLAKIDAHGRCTHGDPENDVCKFYPLESAATLMIPAQRALLERLRERLEQEKREAACRGRGGQVRKSPQEVDPMAETVRIKTIQDGPYEVRGPVELVDSRNRPFQISEQPIYLCRCGHSANKPFCDGSHKQFGFQANESAR